MTSITTGENRPNIDFDPRDVMQQVGGVVRDVTRRAVKMVFAPSQWQPDAKKSPFNTLTNTLYTPHNK